VRKAFTESIAEVPPRSRVTGRLCRAVARQVASGRAVSALAAEFGVSWPVVHRHFAVHADALLTEPGATAVLGIDETRRGRPRWRKSAAGKWGRAELFKTNFTDLAADGRLLGQTAGRTGATVTGWLDARGQAWKDTVQVVAMDPCAACRSAVQRALPQAQIVVDHFHLVRLANQAVTRVRQRVTREHLGRRGTMKDPAWANRRRLLRAREHLSERAFARMWNDISGHEPPASCWLPGSPKKSSAGCWRWPAPSQPAPTSATGCFASTTGAAGPTCPRSPSSPRPWSPGGRRSWPSSKQASPAPPPKRTTG
jgi:transposase